MRPDEDELREEAVGFCLERETLGCTNTFKDHHWGKVEATNRGWFFKRDLTGQWCPDHLPDWVEEWRARRKQGC